MQIFLKITFSKMEGTQNFDINREYWDYCDESSRHVNFYNMTTPPLPDKIEEEDTQMSFNPDKVIDIMNENEPKEKNPPKLDNAQDIYDFLPVDRQFPNKTISKGHK